MLTTINSQTKAFITTIKNRKLYKTYNHQAVAVTVESLALI